MTAARAPPFPLGQRHEGARDCDEVGILNILKIVTNYSMSFHRLRQALLPNTKKKFGKEKGLKIVVSWDRE